MADNISTPFGTIASKDDDGAHHQKVLVQALLSGGAGARVELLGTSTHGLLVDVTRIAGVLVVAPAKVAVAGRASIAVSIVSVVLRALNAARYHIQLFNRSSSTLYLKYGGDASLTDFDVVIAPEGYWEMPSHVTYTGPIHGIWNVADATGFARVTEL